MGHVFNRIWYLGGGHCPPSPPPATGLVYIVSGSERSMVFCALSLLSFLAGSFQLIIMMFEEYILLIIENQLIAQLDEDLKHGLRRHLKGIFRLTGNLRQKYMLDVEYI